jgi:hypothetical protein
MIAWCGEKHRGIQQPWGFKAMNVGLPKRLPYVFIYEHEKVMFLFHFKNNYYDAWFHNVEKKSKDSTTIWFQGYECWIV